VSGHAEAAAAWIYQGVWAAIVRWFRVPAHPPTLPARGEPVRSLRPSTGFLAYLKFFFWLALIPGDVVPVVLWGLIGFAVPVLGIVLGPLFIALMVLPDVVAYVGIHLRYDTTWYVLTDRSLRIRRGIWVIHETTISFENVQNVEVRQGPLQRMFGIADVIVQTAGGGGGGPHGKGEHGAALGPHVGVLEGIDDAATVRDQILTSVERTRQAGLGDEHPHQLAAAHAGPSGAALSARHVAVLREIRDSVARLAGHTLLVAAIGVGLVAPLPAAAQPPTTRRGIVDLVRHPPSERDSDAFAVAAFDATDQDRRELIALLETATGAERDDAITALGLAGGDLAIEALARLQDDHAIRTQCLPRAARGNAEDRAFLIRVLDERGLDFAAYALGALRERSAVPALERDGGKSTPRASDEALRWIREGPWQVALPARPSEHDRVVAAALRNGIPAIGGGRTWTDGRGSGAWRLDGRTWRYLRTGARAFPMIGFRSTIGANRDRAILAIDVLYRRSNAIGYRYYLVRKAGEWRVVGAVVSWIT
jgi:membrane protein YdbS with pleckstrin-like domain